MSAKASKEISPLLSNNTQYQTYNDDLTSIEIHKQSQSLSQSQSKPSKSSFSSTGNEGNDEHKHKHKHRESRKSRQTSKKGYRVHNKSKSSRHKQSDKGTTNRRRRTTRTLSCHHQHSQQQQQQHSHHSQHVSNPSNFDILDEEEENMKCAKCCGKLFAYMEHKGFNKKLQFAWSNLLCIAITICLLLIVWRVWNISTNTTLWNSKVFMSDSAPLLLVANVIMMMSYSIENFLNINEGFNGWMIRNRRKLKSHRIKHMSLIYTVNVQGYIQHVDVMYNSENINVRKRGIPEKRVMTMMKE